MLQLKRLIFMSYRSKYRDMRMIVFFDLPTLTKKDRKAYTTFRKFLLNNGFDMIQFSVYSRFCRNHADILKHKSRIIASKPSNGEVRIMTVTEKQYLSMKIIGGQLTAYEKTISSDPIIEV